MYDKKPIEEPVKKATIMDVARAAGVSHATVERVLNGSTRVSEGSRSKVLQAIDTLGYIPNRFASSLRMKKSCMIAHMGFLFDNMFFNCVSRGLHSQAEQSQYDIFDAPVYTWQDVQKNAKAANDNLIRLAGFQFDGFVFTSVGSYLENKSIEMIARSKKPIVFLERAHPSIRTDAVLFDDVGGSTLAVEYLVQKGCRNILFVGQEADMSSSPSEQNVERNRIRGYIQTIEKAGLRPKFAFSDGYSVSRGYTIGETLLKSGDIPDGIYATSDLLLCGLVRAFTEKGLSLGKDYQIVGYDNTIAHFLPFQVPSVTYDIDQASKAAFTLLMERMEDPEKPYETIIIPMYLSLNQNSDLAESSRSKSNSNDLEAI